MKRGEFERCRHTHQDLLSSALWAGAESWIQTERTLDETYYPSLAGLALSQRNEGQVVGREWAYTRKNVDLTQMPLLVVPQLWIWTSATTGIISAYSLPHRSPVKHELDILYGHDAPEGTRAWRSRDMSQASPLTTIWPLAHIASMIYAVLSSTPVRASSMLACVLFKLS